MKKDKCIDCGSEEAEVKQLNMFDEYYWYCKGCYDVLMKKTYKEWMDLE